MKIYTISERTTEEVMNSTINILIDNYQVNKEFMNYGDRINNLENIVDLIRIREHIIERKWCIWVNLKKIIGYLLNRDLIKKGVDIIKEFSYCVGNQYVSNSCNKKGMNLYFTPKFIPDNNKYNCCCNENKKEFILPICR